MIVQRRNTQAQRIAVYAIMCILGSILLFCRPGCTDSPPPDPARVEEGLAAIAPCAEDLTACFHAFIVIDEGSLRRDRVWYVSGIDYGESELSLQALQIRMNDPSSVRELVLPDEGERWDALAAKYMRQRVRR